MNKFNIGQEVFIHTGKYTGYYGNVCCYVNPHHLSNKGRVQVRTQSGLGWVTLLINEDNLSESDQILDYKIKYNLV